MNPDFAPKPTNAGGSGLVNIPEATQRGSHHRRAHSENFFRFSDDLLFDVGDLDLSSLDLPSPAAAANNSLHVPMTVDSCRSDESSSDNKSSGTTSRPPHPSSHYRSLSVDADFFEGLSLIGTPTFDGGDGGAQSPAIPVPAEGKRSGMHRRNNSMDGSSSSFEGDSLLDGMKKAMPPEKLAELALLDPKRAKRILANRQSAARSKERKIRYANELEKKVQTLQTEATTLSAQVTMLQRDTTGLTSENRELKLRLQAMEQQAQLKDALNEALKEEVQRLRITTGQIPNRGSNSFAGQQTQQPQSHVAQPSNGQNSQQRRPNFMGFNHRV